MALCSLSHWGPLQHSILALLGFSGDLGGILWSVKQPVMWVNNNKPPIEWFIPPIYGDLEDEYSIFWDTSRLFDDVATGTSRLV